MSELTADAIKLTQQNPDGTFNVLGFDPLSAFYENSALFLGDNFGTQWYQSDGKSAFATDPQWTSLLEWQKSLIDKFGYEDLVKFGQTFNPDTEWSAQHAFETGHLAMMIDGEWREAFIQADKSNVQYKTAPFPTADNQTQLYGSGVIGGDVIGIPRGAQHPQDAWLLLKYLATNTNAEEALAEKLRNVPTTYQSLKDPVLNQDPIFKVFLNIFANEKSGFKPLTPIGSADEDLWGTFLEKWEGADADPGP